MGDGLNVLYFPQKLSYLTYKISIPSDSARGLTRTICRPRFNTGRVPKPASLTLHQLPYALRMW